MTLTFPKTDALVKSPVYSHVAVISPGATLVAIGGQNAVDAAGKLVGGDDAVAQAKQVLINVEAALKAGGCTWAHVFRVTVFIASGVDVRKTYEVFAPALAACPTPPLVTAAVMHALTVPGALLEVSVDAAR